MVEGHLMWMDIYVLLESKQTGVLTGSITQPLHTCWIVVSEEMQAVSSGHKVDAMKVHSVGPALCCQSGLPPLLSLICQLYSTELTDICLMLHANSQTFVLCFMLTNRHLSHAASLSAHLFAE